MGINTFQNLAESTRLVNMAQPQNINNVALVSTPVNLGKYAHASIVIPIGTQAGASTITLEQCQDAAGTGATAVPFDYYVSSATGSDVLGARTAATSAGVATDGATANIQYVIEKQSADLAPGYNFLRVKMSNPGLVNFNVAVIGVLTTARYAGQPANMPSALV